MLAIMYKKNFERKKQLLYEKRTKNSMSVFYFSHWVVIISKFAQIVLSLMFWRSEAVEKVCSAVSEENSISSRRSFSLIHQLDARSV